MSSVVRGGRLAAGAGLGPAGGQARAPLCSAEKEGAGGGTMGSPAYNQVPTICEKRITVTVSSVVTSRL